jgi:hypothetical protein
VLTLAGRCDGRGPAGQPTRSVIWLVQQAKGVVAVVDVSTRLPSSALAVITSPLLAPGTSGRNRRVVASIAATPGLRTVVVDATVACG